MNTSENTTSSGPALPCATDWNAINWPKVEKYVNNLQQRIYRAASLKDYRRVKKTAENVFYIVKLSYL